MYKLFYRWGYFMERNRWLMYLLSVTWGFLTFFIGLLITFALLICGFKPVAYNGIYYFPVGTYWGGFEMGLMFVRDKHSYEDLSAHEFGHGFAQTTLLGPFMFLLVSIPSCIRYWIIMIRERHNKPNKDYDSIWFEASATDCGLDILYDRAQKQKEKEASLKAATDNGGK